jgi:Tfp pilus assembly protein PilF
MPVGKMKKFLLQYSGQPQQTRSLIIMIALAVVACYLPTLNNGFVWDDTVNFVENINYRGLSPSHLSWMFTTFYDANYHPLTWLTLGLDFVLWGMNPAGYHLTNVAIHALNAILFYLLITAFLRLVYMSSPNIDISVIRISAAAGALFFGIHPLRVETVAWISTRGDLLCGSFYILTIIFYLRMNDKNKTPYKRKWFLLSLLSFILSLLSRAWGVTLPLILLIIDVYPLRRLAWKEQLTRKHITILMEKIPFGILALGAGIQAILAKKSSMLMLSKHGIIDRIVQALYGLCFYVWKTIAPVKLSPFYMLDKSFDPMEPKYILCALLVCGITAGLMISRRIGPWALTILVCYTVIVFPLLGIVQSGPQITADRYTYISCMPFGILVGAGILRLLMSMQKKNLFSATRIFTILLIYVGFIVLSMFSLRQNKIWHDNRTFWNHVLKLNPSNYVAYYNRGVLNQDQGDLNAAIADYNLAILSNPEYSEAFYNRAVAHKEQKKIKDAISDYTSVIRFDPENFKAYNNRGDLLEKQGNLAGAIADFNVAIGLKPSSPEAYANRGIAYMAQNNQRKAIEDFSKALEVAPANWSQRRAWVEQLIVNARITLEEQKKSVSGDF